MSLAVRDDHRDLPPQSQISAPTPFSATDTRTFAVRLAALALVIGAVLRLRILFASPLRSSNLFLWMLEGTAQDLTVACALVILATLCGRGRWMGFVVRTLLVATVLLLAILHVAHAEGVVFFGHALQAKDVQLGVHPRVILGSAQGGILAGLVALIVGYILLVAWIQRSAKKRHTRLSLRQLGIAGVLAAIVTALPIPIHHEETTAHPIFALARLIRGGALEPIEYGVDVPPPTVSASAIRMLMPSRRALLDPQYPLAYLPPARSAAAVSLPRGARPNIVFFLMEGVRDHEVGVYGGTIPGLTPNIDKLAREGIRINGLYSVGGLTPEGELAAWYGLNSSPPEIVIRSRPHAVVSGLPEALRQHGWRDFLWVHPGDATFYLSTRFYLHHGFKTIDGRDFPPDDPRTNWGYSDRALARRAIEAIDRAREPFAAMALTVSNHHPFQLPEDAQSDIARMLPAERRGYVRFPGTAQLLGFHTVPMLRTLHYTDESLGYFMELARKRPWFHNTIFVVLGDHGSPTIPLSGSVESVHQFMQLRYRVPAILYSPLLPGGRVVEGPASQADLVPTLLGLVGIDGPRAGLGIDLLDPADRDPERPIVSFNHQAHSVSILRAGIAYHAQVAREGANPVAFESEVLVDTEADPSGMQNLIATRPNDVAWFRNAVRTYVEVYPWLIQEGRSGLPPASR